jgi:GLPGLI family protein
MPSSSLGPDTVSKSNLKYLTLTLLAILFVGCNRKKVAGLPEGRIEFLITYEQQEVGGYSASLLPAKMIMEFRDNMGFFNLVNLSDLNNYRFITYLRFIDKKYIFTGDKNEPPCCFGLMHGMNIEFTKQTKEIIGFDCRKAIASFPDGSIESFDIWYTEELQLNKPNGNSPFKKIPGVLLEFNTIMGNANMHMVAKNCDVTRIPARVFDLPKNYKEVSKLEMETILNALLD